MQAHTLEAMGSDTLQQQKEICSVLWEIFKVLVDHFQSTLKHSIKNLGDVLSYATL